MSESAHYNCLSVSESFQSFDDTDSRRRNDTLLKKGSDVAVCCDEKDEKTVPPTYFGQSNALRNYFLGLSNL